ncbi:hypothetical protein K439DRAFT_903944 [Ramaria rubella]|nr:hypothetical protein K439DRAFT_903944 [Ramaria rubella]
MISRIRPNRINWGFPSGPYVTFLESFSELLLIYLVFCYKPQSLKLRRSTSVYLKSLKLSHQYCCRPTVLVSVGSNGCKGLRAA